MPAPAPRVLIVDADNASAQRIGLALDGSGVEVGWCSFAPGELAAILPDLKPSLLVVHAELASPQFSTLLTRLEAANLADLPMVMLCRDVGEEAFTRSMRTGLVEMLAEPFNPRAHLNKVRNLLSALPERSGRLRGRGEPNELATLVHHVMRTHRTGGVAVGEHEEGRAFFVRGVLKSARYSAQTMQAALTAMTRVQSPWTFVEGVEGTAGVIDLEKDGLPEPTAPARASLTQPGENVPPRDPFDEPAAEPLPQPSPPAGPATSVSLLFVDDEPAVVHMLGSYFAKKGYAVVTAADGLEAIAKLVAQPFDAVIADLNMPRLDGWGLLRMVREDFRIHELPIALFSAQDNYRESLRLLHAGAQAYFPKSLRLTALEVQVKELLEPRRRFVRLIGSEGGMEFDLGSLGPQWVCRALSLAGFTGQVDARDTWGMWRLFFEGGRLAQATAKIGATLLSGDRALAAFLTAKSASGSLLSRSQVNDEGFGGHPTLATLERLVPWLNEEHRRARESELAKAQALNVNEDLYRLYVTVGPPAWLPMARLLCEAKLPPVEVIAQLRVSPADVAAVVKDLIRRGVVSLQ